MIYVEDPLLLRASKVIALSATEHHDIKKVTAVTPRTDGTVSFKLNGEDYSADFVDDNMRERFKSAAKRLGVLRVA